MTPIVYVAITTALISATSLLLSWHDLRRSVNKKIGWRVLTRTSVVVENAQGIGDLAVIVGPEVVAKPWLLIVEFINIGKNGLTAQHIAMPPRVAIASGKVVKAEVRLRTRGSKEHRLLEDVEVYENAVQITPRIMNPGDALEVVLVVDGDDPTAVASMHAQDFDLVALPPQGVSRWRSLLNGRGRYLIPVAMISGLTFMAAILVIAISNL